MKSLSPAQRAALYTLDHHPCDPIGCNLYIGPTWRRTLSVLEAAGLVRFFPTGGPKRRGLWKTTAAGRARAKEEWAIELRESEQGEQ